MVKLKLSNQPWIKILKKIAEISVLIICFLIVAKYLAGGWPIILKHLAEIQPEFLIASWFLFGCFFLGRFLAWRVMIFSLHGKISWHSAAKIWFLSEFSRYVPGNIWSFLGRVYLGSKEGIEKKFSIQAMLLEVLFLVGSSVVVGAFFFILWPYQGLMYKWVAILAIPALLFILWPAVLEKVLKKILRLLKQPQEDLEIKQSSLVVVFLLYIVSWIAYGLASYFTMRAFQLSGNIIWLTAMFVIAWLAGYLSFVTPMGLGVREGAIVLFLGKISGKTLASFTALITRFALIITELSIIGTLAIWLGKKEIDWKKIKDWMKLYRHELILTGLILLYTIYFTTLTFLRHANYLTSRYDLGNMDQTVWNTAHGNIFQMTRPEWEGTISRFNFHADWFMILISPIYKIWESPYALLLLQTVVLAMGAIPLYLLAKQILKSKKFALLIAFAYLMFPPMQRANIFDFHSVTLATTFLLCAFYYAFNKMYILFTIFAILALSTKENMAFLVGMMGLYIWIFQKNRRFGLSAFFASAAWFYLLLWHIIPTLRGSEGSHFAISYYADLGDSPTEIFKSLVTKPASWLPRFLRYESLRYLFYFTFPTGFFALFSPILLIALPEIFLNLLSSYDGMQTIYFQYTSAITPFAFIGMIFGIKKALEMKKIWKIELTQKNIFRIIGFCLAINTFAWSPLPGMLNHDTKPLTYRHPDKIFLDKLARDIPTSASVSATTNISPHFGHRVDDYLFPNGVGKADYIIVQENDWYELLPIDEMSKAIRNLEKDARYELIYKNGNLQVFKKRLLTM